MGNTVSKFAFFRGKRGNEENGKSYEEKFCDMLMAGKRGYDDPAIKRLLQLRDAQQLNLHENKLPNDVVCLERAGLIEVQATEEAETHAVTYSVTMYEGGNKVAEMLAKNKEQSLLRK